MSATTVTVVGGGLVGSLVSCFLSRRGMQVDMFEMRPDIRRCEHVPGKSINLALSERGRSALRTLGLEDELLNSQAIPMYGRLIHDLNGERRPIPYGRKGQAIYSVCRRHLNELLLNEAQKSSHVRLHFGHKFIGNDLRKGNVEFEVDSSQTSDKTRRLFSTKAIIGCDGAHSSVRRALLKAGRFDFSQQYIDHGYIELSIQPKLKAFGNSSGGGHRMEVNYLHIWPRGTFMMIALPNKDGSFTVTLFMPFKWFKAIDTEDKLVNFFEQNFPDAIPLIGR